jgi:hypothetical protein
MNLIAQSVQRCLARGVLVLPTKKVDVYWTPSVATKLAAASARRGTFVELRYPDIIVGSYKSLRALRERLRSDVPFLWLGTDIHHITENQHLGFVGRRGVIGDHSYNHEEPCVLLPADHHRLLMHSLIGGSVSLHSEERESGADFGIDYIKQYEAHRRANPVRAAGARPTRSEKARHRAAWVARQPPGTRQKIADQLTQIYEFAYQQSQERPLDYIAADTIRLLAE